MTFEQIFAYGFLVALLGGSISKYDAAVQVSFYLLLCFIVVKVFKYFKNRKK